MKHTWLVNDAKNFEIVQGEDRPLSIRLLDSSTNAPIDLTGATLSLELANADGTVLILTPTLDGAGELGKISAPVSAAESALLKVGEKQYMELTYTRDLGEGVLDKRIVLMEKALTVVAQPF